LMGLPRKPEKVRKSLLLEIFDLMIWGVDREKKLLSPLPCR
jgi:hypothetical protein